MAQTILRVTRTVSTDLTNALVVYQVSNALTGQLAALDNLDEQTLKALTIIGIANYLNTTLGGVNYTANYEALNDQALTLLGTVDPLQGRQKALLECALALNAYMYATSVTSLSIKTLVATATTSGMTILPLPQLQRMLAVLRYLSGN